MDVDVRATFGGPGEAGRDLTYIVRVDGDAPRAALDELVRATDAIAEVHNALRVGCAVQLVD